MIPVVCSVSVRNLNIIACQPPALQCAMVFGTHFPCSSHTSLVPHTLPLFLTLGSLGLIFYCIAMDYAALPGNAWLHYMLFLFSIVLLVYLEGLQVTILSLELSLEHVSPTSLRYRVWPYLSP